MGDKTRGLYEKFTVTRNDGSSEPGGKHCGCEYFVLDLTHDPHAASALKAYADSCADDYPLLADDLRSKLPTNAAPCGPREADRLETVEIVEWEPTPELRWHSPDRRYVPERLERRFFCKASDGTTWRQWVEVHQENSFVRVDKTPNA